MLIEFFKFNWIYILLFFGYHLFLYINRLNTNNPIPHLNFIIYFLSLLLIKDTLNKTKFNKQLVLSFFIFYGYLSVILSLSILLRNHPIYSSYLYFYIDLILRILILNIALYLLLYSVKFWKKSEYYKLTVSFLISLLLIYLNHFSSIIIKPYSGDYFNWSDWILRNYITMVLVIILLLAFWYRYYNKYCVLSDYLNSIIFLFTLSNLIEPLHFIAMQWNIQNWVKGQVFNLIINFLIMVLWYHRLVYLKSDISVENERYLMNFQYLNGIISKPRKSIISNITAKISANTVYILLIGFVIIISLLFAIKKITLFLLLNTAFISIIIILALFFSISSLKRDWQKQYNVFLKNRKD